MSEFPEADIIKMCGMAFNDRGMCTIDADFNVYPCDYNGYAKWVATFPGKTTPERERAARRSGVVQQDEIGHFRVSTVCLFLNHSWEGGEAWFESMVFENDDMSGIEQERYATVAEARVGHERLAEKYRAIVDAADTSKHPT